MFRTKIDATSLDRLAVQMKAAERTTRSSYRKGLKEIGNSIRDDARARIVEISPETAAELKVSTSIPKASVSVQGGTKARRIGKLLEGHDGQQGEWRHPLFGDREHWYSQARHPHLFPAFEAHKKDAMKNLKRNVKDGIHAAGLKGPSA